jgi:hypothetical protein
MTNFQWPISNAEFTPLQILPLPAFVNSRRNLTSQQSLNFSRFAVDVQREQTSAGSPGEKQKPQAPQTAAALVQGFDPKQTFQPAHLLP